MQNLLLSVFESIFLRISQQNTKENFRIHLTILTEPSSIQSGIYITSSLYKVWIHTMLSMFNSFSQNKDPMIRRLTRIQNVNNNSKNEKKNEFKMSITTRRMKRT